MPCCYLFLFLSFRMAPVSFLTLLPSNDTFSCTKHLTPGQAKFSTRAMACYTIASPPKCSYDGDIEDETGQWKLRPAFPLIQLRERHLDPVPLSLRPSTSFWCHLPCLEPMDYSSGIHLPKLVLPLLSTT